MNLRTFLATLIVAAALAAGLGAYAETAPVFFLFVTPSPAPQAGTVVTISVTTPNFPIATATYTWYRDGARLESASGVGRSSVEIATDAAKTESIIVAVDVAPGTGFSTLRSSMVIQTVPSQEQLKKQLEDIESSFSVAFRPEAPNPNEAVDVEVTSFAFDRELASYRWFVDGVLQRDESGKGRWFLSLPGIAEGTSQTIRAEVTTPLGVTRSQSITLAPVTTALYWWTNTLVPPWYKGKALPTSGAQVTLLALPNVRNTSSIRYRWEFHNAPDQKASGIGKATYSFPISYTLPETLEIAMDDVSGGAFQKTTSITVEPVRPSVGIYELRPRRGALTARYADAVAAAAGGTLEFIAIPFFFPFGSDRYLRYEWTSNRKMLVGEPPDPWHFILKSIAGEESNNRLSIEIRDTRTNGEAASASFTA